MRDHLIFAMSWRLIAVSKFAAVNGDDQALYFRGEQTYLDVFGPHNKFAEPVGKVGFGFAAAERSAVSIGREPTQIATQS